jgi:hypothetical protein
MNTMLLNQTENMATGLVFILFPLIFIFAFAVHLGLSRPHLLNPKELIQRAHHADLLQFGHVLVTFNAALLIVVALHFMNILENSSAGWAGFLGGVLAILGAIMLAADKGALCLTMSAFDTLTENEFLQSMPGILALFNKKGWLILLWGILLLPIGFSIQTVALLSTGIFPLWQGILFLIGVLLVGTPDGLEPINLTASILMAIACMPYGIQIILSVIR